MKKVRRDTAGQLNGTDILEVAGTHSDSQQLIQQLAKDICNIVFMDVDVPGINAPEIAGIVKATYPELNVLLLSASKNSHSITSVSPRSTVYDEQDASQESLLALSAQVHEAALQHNIAVVEKVLAFFNRRSQHDIGQYGLSPREQEVLDRLVDGHTYKKIAELCHISVGTVRSHIMNIYRKLEVNSRSAAIVKAMRGS